MRTAPITPGIAFITGGARGLGNAVARSFAKDGSAGIALVDVQDEATFQEAKEAVEKLGTEVCSVRPQPYLNCHMVSSQLRWGHQEPSLIDLNSQTDQL